MSLAIKLVILFLLIESSFAKQKPDLDVFDYSSYFKQMIEGWQREAFEKYPFRRDLHDDFRIIHDQVHANISFYLQDKAKAYVHQWENWKPYRDLGEKIGVLWATEDNTCPNVEAMNLLTYMIHGLSRPYSLLRLLKIFLDWLKSSYGKYEIKLTIAAALTLRNLSNVSHLVRLQV